jgi:hypothetical protein
MGGFFSNDGTGWEHDCDGLLTQPTGGISFTCPECEVEWFTAVSHDDQRWVWVSARTGRART